jgi:D-tyrosyl-tRNA(Tyr) deacylase
MRQLQEAERMRAVVQRVKRARVEVNQNRVGSIEVGLLVYVGVHSNDEAADVGYLCDKILGLRIFEDSAGKMNLSVEEVGGSLLLVSQFTLYGDCRKGKRPSFSEAAPPEKAQELYDLLTTQCRARGIRVETGVFRQMMEVDSINDGPVTLLLDSRKEF